MAPKRPRDSVPVKKRPSKKKDRPKLTKKINLNDIQVPLTNRFAELSDDESEMLVGDDSPKHAKKVSPIVVTDVKKDIQKILNDLKIKCDIKIVSIGKKIFVQSIDDKTKIIESLKTQKINFFSHPDDANNTFKVVLSGLPEIDTNEIITEMQTTYSIEVTKVVMFNTKSQSKLYLCHITKTKNLNLKTLNTIKVIYHHIVKWQAYKPKQQPTQCYRCCMYGHGARSCNRYAICILCSGNHLTKQCTIILPNTVNPEYKCFNCMSAKLQHNHKANDPKCVFRAKYVVTKEMAQSKHKQKPPSKRHASERENNSTEYRYVRAPQPPPLTHTFAATTKNKQNPQTLTSIRQASSSLASNASMSTNTFAPSNSSDDLWTITEVAQLLSQSINELKQCSSKLDQLNVIARLLSHACN